jgi:hypothetical protein
MVGSLPRELEKRMTERDLARWAAYCTVRDERMKTKSKG